MKLNVKILSLLAWLLGWVPVVIAQNITSVSPSYGPTAGGVLLTVSGSGFRSSLGTVTLGGNTCPVTSWNGATILCTLPAGQGANLNLIVTTSAGDKATNTQFSYSAPTITSIAPLTGPTVGGTSITVLGNNFGVSGQVTLGGTDCPVTSWENTRILCTTPACQGSNVPLVVTVSGQTGSNTQFSFPPPKISSISPTGDTTAGGATLTVSGSSFGPKGAVTLDGTNCPVISWTDSAITCTVPAGQGKNLPLVVTAGGQTANTDSFSYYAPVITSIAPGEDSTQGGSLLTISGTNFGLSGTVKLDYPTCSVTSWDHGRITCTVPPGEGAHLPLVVTVSGQTTTNNSFSYSPPVISSVSPLTGPTGGGTTIRIRGTNFGENLSGRDRVALGGNLCPYVTWNYTNIICIIPSGQGTNLPLVVTVNGQEVTTQFSYSAPSITSVSPMTGPTTGGTSLTISGDSFGASGTVTLGGTNCTIYVYSHNSIVCTAPAGQGKNVPLVVTVGGRSVTNTQFSYLPPTISSISPMSGPITGGTLLTVSGNNFGANGTVTLGGTVCPVTAWSNALIRCTTPVGREKDAPLVVTVEGQSAVRTFSYQSLALSLMRNDFGLMLSWLSEDNYVLETSTILGGNPESWTNASIMLLTNGSRVDAVIHPQTENRFFRLHKP